MKARKTRLDILTLGYTNTTILPCGRSLTVGDEFKVKGEGKFRLQRVRPNGELNAWGPIRATTGGQESTRTFRREQAIVNRKPPTSVTAPADHAAEATALP